MYSARVYEPNGGQGNLFGDTGELRSSLGAGLYKDSNLYYLSFKGTKEIVKDMAANTGQSLGFSPVQYDQALTITKMVMTKLGHSRIVVVGHSLGGGLASYAASNTGLTAHVFNPAGVHRFNRAGSGSKNLITAYQIPGEILGQIQNGLTPLGFAMPNTYGRLKVMDYSGGGWSGYRHGIARFLSDK